MEDDGAGQFRFRLIGRLDAERPGTCARRSASQWRDAADDGSGRSILCRRAGDGRAPAGHQRTGAADHAGMRAGLLAALAAIALPMPALASGVIDNVNGIALDAQGRIVHFNALLIDDEGKVEKLLPGRYQEPPPPPKRKKRKGEQEAAPKRLDFKL